MQKQTNIDSQVLEQTLSQKEQTVVPKVVTNTSFTQNNIYALQNTKENETTSKKLQNQTVSLRKAKQVATKTSLQEKTFYKSKRTLIHKFQNKHYHKKNKLL